MKIDKPLIIYSTLAVIMVVIVYWVSNGGGIKSAENEMDSEEYESIEIYNLRKSIIHSQKLDVWPSIVDLKNLTELNTNLADSLILFIAETDNGDKLRLTRTMDLTNFTELNYAGDCKREGTILTDLKIGKINLSEMKAIILCKSESYGEMEINN